MKKPESYYQQSGVIPFRKNGTKIELLLITSRKKKSWIFPKGIIENKLSPQQSAAKEAIEEAGVMGKVFKKKVGKYYLQKWDGICEVKIYLMEVDKILKSWQEEKIRNRKWVSVDAAKELIKNKQLQKIVKNLDKSDFAN
ncbi:MAG: NUDIX hydrolase [Melioribacteraceae bacterium]|nr:NUDIX hydrolase [Melioribacteraceae bacterium]MCO6474722.1 NUDIX hydrolase [Melioribacteraceae bacterium]MDD3557793.1 NUDIX hydrolase [Melioribacteraceae bacterium]